MQSCRRSKRAIRPRHRQQRSEYLWAEPGIAVYLDKGAFGEGRCFWNSISPHGAWSRRRYGCCDREFVYSRARERFRCMARSDWVAHTGGGGAGLHRGCKIHRWPSRDHAAVASGPYFVVSKRSPPSDTGLLCVRNGDLDYHCRHERLSRVRLGIFIGRGGYRIVRRLFGSAGVFFRSAGSASILESTKDIGIRVDRAGHRRQRFGAIDYPRRYRITTARCSDQRSI